MRTRVLSRRSIPRRVAATLATALLTASCSGAGSTPRAVAEATTARPAPSTSTHAATSTTSPPPPTASSVATPKAAAAPAPPAALLSALSGRLAALRTHDVTVSVSIAMEGYGEIVAEGADRLLLPASNEKILTAIGVFDLLDPQARLETAVAAAGVIAGGDLTGDLVLVAGGDPSLTSVGPHSLDALASRVAETGIVHVSGGLVVDESRHDDARTAPGWPEWVIPTYAGPLSALVVDDNRGRSDAAFLAEPAREHAEAFEQRLAAHGVKVDGGVTVGRRPTGAKTVATLTSAPIAALARHMLLESDNEHAELLTREIGRARAGTGSTPAGAAAIAAAAAARCSGLHGTVGDGSGMSRHDLRSARELRRILEAVRRAPWWPAFRAGLPVGARSGTLRDRFGGTAAAGNVRAKTGTIIGGTALSGYLTTAGGRDVVFSIVVNGPGAKAATADVDALVVALAGDRS